MATLATLLIVLSLAPAPLSDSAILATIGHPPTRPLTTQEKQLTYIRACLAFEISGNPDYIAIDAGESESQGLAELECDDYKDAVTAERAFLRWYHATSRRLGLSSNPDDPRHAYDYRAFYRAVVEGRAWMTGRFFPRTFQTGK